MSNTNFKIDNDRKLSKVEAKKINGMEIQNGTPVLSSFLEKATAAEISTDTTLTENNSGPIFVNCASAVVLTLPGTVVGLAYVIIVTKGNAKLSISPNASDKIIGLNNAGTDNKDLIIAHTNKGNYVKLIGDGTDGWFIQEAAGTFSREA